MRPVLLLGCLALLSGCLDSVDENAWKHRDGRPGADGQVTDVRVDGPAHDGLPDQGPDGPLTECNDGQDNDGDGKIDYKTDGTGDPDCTGPADTSEASGGNVCASASWSQLDCKTTSAKCQAECALDGLPYLIVACKPAGCTCGRDLTVNTCSTPPGQLACTDCQAAFASGCCNGL